MRKVTLFVLAGSMLFMTSCLEIIEEFYLNKDGSGKYTMMLDMKGMFENPFMKSAMEKEAKKNGDDGQEMEQDSIMYYKDMIKEGDLTAEEQRLIGDLSMNMVVSEKDSKFYISSEVPFASLEELHKINAILAKLKDNKTEGEDMGGLGSLLGGTGTLGGNEPQFSLKRRKLTRLPELIKDEEPMDEENMDYMKMFLGDATHTTIYHLPGKVRKSTMQNAVIDGKTVTVKVDFLDVLQKKINSEGYIKYKRR